MTILERRRSAPTPMVPMLLLSLVACGDSVESESGRDRDLAVEAVPPGGDFADAIVVRLAADRPANIVYTTDGSLPSAATSPSYVGPLRLTESTLLSFMAVGEDGARSEIATEWYDREEPPLGPIELPAKSVRVQPDRLVFTPGSGIQFETAIVRLQSIGTEPVTVFAMTRGPAGATASSYDPEAFQIIPNTTDPVIRPGEEVELQVTYYTTRTSRTMRLDIETDAENVARGVQSLFLFGRMFP